MSGNFDIDALRAFVAIAETLSFSQAGVRLGRSQSAISLKLGLLEQTVGRQLVDRRQGRVRGLTTDGQRMLGYAQRMLRLNDDTWSALVGTELTGVVRLGIPADFLDQAFAEVLGRFRQQHAMLRIEVKSDLSVSLQNAVAEGDLDVAFFKQDPEADGGERIRRDALVWYGLESDLPAQERSVPLVAFPEGCLYRKRMIDTLSAHDIPWHVAFESPSSGAVRAVVKTGLGVTALPVGLRDELPACSSLPALADVEIAYRLAPGSRNQAGRQLARYIADEIAQPAAGVSKRASVG